MQIIDGKSKSKEILERIKHEVENLDFTPIFCDVLVGNDLASKKYVELKKKKALDLGIKFYDAHFDERINTEELINQITNINIIPNMCGIIVQLPLPPQIDSKKVLDSIDSKVDVDCLGEELSNKFYNGDLFLSPPTALACMYLLDSLGLNIEDKNILIVGEGKLVGKPLANIFKHKNLNFKIINSRTENKENFLKEADVIISGVGKGNIVFGDMVKDPVIVIDAGTAEEDSVLVGDIDFDSVSKKASFITPVPGGVGPMTIAMLFSNILKVAKNKNE